MWAKLDDAILDNPKIIAAGALGFAMHVAAITWSARNLTDGFIPGDKVAVLINWNGVLEHLPLESDTPGDFVTGSEVSWLALAESLVTLRLWHEVPGGYLIHDFLIYNKSKEQVLAERASAKRRRSPDVRPNNERSSVAPVPVPVPVLSSPDVLPEIVKKPLVLVEGGSGETKPLPSRKSARAKPKTLWPDDFTLTAELRRYTERNSLDADYQFGKFQTYATAHGKTYADWPAAFKYWVRNAWELEQRRSVR